MGNKTSRLASTEQSNEFISHSMNVLREKPSEFYYACEKGDMNRVYELLPTISKDKKLYKVEPNGDTALHAATRSGHHSIVALLLAHGFSRAGINHESKTAYELASTDKMRSLFHRPMEELRARYIDEHPDKTMNLLDLNGDTNYQALFNNANDAIQAQYMARFNRTPKFLRNIVKTMTEARSIEILEKTVKNLNIKGEKKTGDYILLQNSFDNFLHQKDANHLVHLYTLNELYKAIREDSAAYTTLIYLHLASMSERAYQGISYRAIKMSFIDVIKYYYAMKTPNSVIETRNFSSTSKNKNVARMYSAHGVPPTTVDDDRYDILLIFHFPNPCKTSIDLTRLSDRLPPISQYEDEEEVLVLPYTLFRVINVTETTVEEPFSIYLQNVPVPEQSLISFLTRGPAYC